MDGKEPLCGLAFIVEGPTEKVFYLEYLSQLCKAKGLVLKRIWTPPRTAISSVPREMRELS